MKLFFQHAGIGGTSHMSWMRVLLALLLVAVLPVFIWAVLTQRIELRKRAATAEPTQICWNRVIQSAGTYSWPSSCKGSARLDLACRPITLALTPAETTQYSDWVNAGSPFIPGCQPLPAQCYLQQVQCVRAPCDPILVCPSITPAPSNCQNLAPGTNCNLINCPTTACKPGQMCTQQIRPCTFIPGTCQSGRCTPIGTRPTPTPTPSSTCVNARNGATCTHCRPCTSKICPAVCVPEAGTCLNGQCISSQPTPPANCYYQQVQCIQAPCPPILVCPTGIPTPTATPSPSPTPTPTPTLLCNLRAPTVTITPANQSGHPGDALLYNITFTNNDSAVCGPSDFALSGQVATGWQYALTNTVVPNVNPGQQAGVNFTITSAAGNPTTTNVYPVSAYVKNVRSSLQSRADAAYTVVPNAPQQVEFRVKLAGVTDSQADGAKMNVKFTKQDGTNVQFSAPLTLAHIGNGIYKATALLTNPFPSGTKFNVQIKGEKHSAIRFTHQSGQTNQCSDGQYMTMPNPVPTSYVYDFTGVPLPAGDTVSQDGQVNQADIDRIVALLAKPSDSLTDTDKLTGDLNYDGVVNGYDLFLILQTLRTRCDAN